MNCKYIFPVLLFSGTVVFSQSKNDNVLPNENLIAENIPVIPKSLNEKIKKYSAFCYFSQSK